jgi:large subunit ribosomal protein L21
MANDFAVIESGRQYKVAVGDKINFDTLEAKQGDRVTFDKVLLRSTGEKVEVGAPYVTGAKVQGTVVRHARERKKIVFKYHSKTRQKKKKGHRQGFTEVEIVSI